jgi:hypothetical protein
MPLPLHKSLVLTAVVHAQENLDVLPRLEARGILPQALPEIVPSTANAGYARLTLPPAMDNALPTKVVYSKVLPCASRQVYFSTSTSLESADATSRA